MSFLIASTSPLATTSQPITGGSDAIAGIGMNYLFNQVGPFITGDKITLDLTDNLTGLLTQVGAGNVTGENLTFCLTFNDKIYAAAGTDVFFCAVGDGTKWNDPNGAGNSFIQMSNNYGMSNDISAIAIYQGRLAFVGRQQVQIWSVDPDPSLNKQVQVLPNIGTVAKLSVQSIGDMDVYMLADNGFRSVRVRDASNNAIIADIGTPVDAIVEPLLASLTDAQKAAACGIVEPSSNRYWCYIPQPDGSAGQIYVFSYFTSSQIAAWGTYNPTYQLFIDAPLANYPVVNSMNYTVVAGTEYYWNKGVNDVSLSDGDNVLYKSGYITAQGTIISLDGNGPGLPVTCTLETTVSFVPEKFIVFNGQVYVRSGDNVFQYGGDDNSTYDRSGLTFTTPYIDSGTPATKKQFTGVDAAMEGTWELKAAFDFNVNKYRTVWQGTQPTFLGANIGWAATGTHYSFQANETGNGYARFASLLCHQQGGDNS